ncbi:HvfX family Cu-binding RiPP maturation protein [Calditrichota bacterium LG25]
MKELYLKYKNFIQNLTDLPPLFFRLILSYGFFEPALKKLNNIDSIAQWFASMNYPFPTLNAYLAGITEFSGSILLLLGLGTRLISLPLMFVMLMAIFTVHLGNGFAAGNNGFEIPLYYLLMLFSLTVSGAGKFSLDHVLSKNIGAK